jgi:NADPH:quinone reductase-like Zn-dependent oxidoreductase
MSIPSTMRAILLTGHGGLEKLEYRDDYPVPEPSAEEVLIQVAACGMNNTDINTRVGWYAGGSWGGEMSFPRIQGADPVGRVVAVGRDVAEDRVGETVAMPST